MGVLIIGDRFAGKSQLVNALAEPGAKQLVETKGWDYLLPSKIERTEVGLRPPERFEIHVDLPSGIKALQVDLLDTAGELWREDGPTNHPDDWKLITDISRDSEGILLILPPYTDLLRPEDQERHGLGTYTTWSNRFKRWVQFFRQDCPKARHLLICLHKADLFCKDLDTLTHRLAYQRGSQAVGWHDRHDYVLKRYYRPIADQINQLATSRDRGSVQCFITSIDHRPLVELPWIYLASHISTDSRFSA